jgi:hypothetical protein
MRYIKRVRHTQHFVITERGEEALVTTVEDIGAAFVVKDSSGQKLGLF